AILLALDNKDDCFGRHDKLRQPVRDRANAFGRPYPLAFAVWPALQEILRLLSDDLKQQCAGLIAVVIRRDNAPGSARFSAFNINTEFSAKPFGNFISGDAAFVVDQFDRTAADRILVVIPFAAIGASHLQREAAVIAKAQLSAGRTLLVLRAENVPRDLGNVMTQIGFHRRCTNHTGAGGKRSPPIALSVPRSS